MHALLQFALFLTIVSLLVRPVGIYLTRVFERERTWPDAVLLPLERRMYRIAAVDPTHEMGWREYAASFIRFSLLGAVLLYLILRLQQYLPWYDEAYITTPMTSDLALNTAVSFATTTTWQAYAGESTMSYTTQMVGLASQNFLAGAAGLAVGVAFIRGLARRSTGTLGNFWVDLVRAILWVLLPVSIIGSLVLVWQGVPMNFDAYSVVTTVTGSQQVIAQGPVAALEFIKNLGTNGGGFFNANGAHPFENPTPLTNLLEMLAIVVIPASLTYVLGRMTGRQRDGWMLYWVMVLLFAGGLLLAGWAEQGGNPLLPDSVDQQTAGNMEGKELRFGVDDSVLTAVTTSNGATGSYNSMHDSFTPLGGAVPLANMLLGELIFGGLGSGIYSMVIVMLFAVFVMGGLMIGRTPEYLGKRIGPSEARMVAIYIVMAPMTILSLTALAVVTKGGLAGLTTNSGVHGFTEILFGYTSAFANNGQNFAGLSANSEFYNLTMTLAMLIGRFGLVIPVLAIAGSFARLPTRQPTRSTLTTASPLFATVLIGTILIVGALTFLPAIVLGPVVEHFMMTE